MFTVIGAICVGKKGSTYRSPRKTSLLKSSVILTPAQQDAVVGTMLGDSSMERAKENHSPRLRFEQSFPSHANYLTQLYILFQNLVGQCPRVTTRKPDSRTGISYSTVSFKTLAFPCFTYYFNLFHLNGVKVVPTNIAQLLTPRALAYWIMDDGGKGSYGEMILHTRSFTLSDVQLLQSALTHNFGLRTRLIEKTPSQWVIVILVKQDRPLKDIVAHYMTPCMLYKLH